MTTGYRLRSLRSLRRIRRSRRAASVPLNVRRHRPAGWALWAVGQDRSGPSPAPQRVSLGGHVRRGIRASWAIRRPSLGNVAGIVLRVFGAWTGAISSGVSLPIGQLIGMYLRQTPVQLVADAHVALAERGRVVDLGRVEAGCFGYRSSIRTRHDPVKVVEAAISAAE